MTHSGSCLSANRFGDGFDCICICENEVITHDFGDGNGPVPAHQHSNGGGWVAESATVAESAYIGLDAEVFGNARVFGDAYVYGNAQVFGDVQVFENAEVRWDVWHSNVRPSVEDVVEPDIDGLLTAAADVVAQVLCQRENSHVPCHCSPARQRCSICKLSDALKGYIE